MDASERRRRIAAEAAEWWVVMHRGASHTEQERYVDWLRESALHVAEMLHVASVDGALARFTRWDDISSVPREVGSAEILDLSSRLGTTLPGESAHGRSRSARQWVVALGAIAATGLLLVLGWQFWYAPSVQVIQTERGERRQVVLEDGSMVQADPQSRLLVEYRKTTRYIELERGRAFFHVAPKPGRPFVVQAGQTRVRALGTAFAVDRSTEALVVTVAEGKVAVSPTDRTVGIGATAAAPSGPTLVANQQLRVEASGGAQSVTSVDSAQALAWTEGRLVFENERIADAAREFNRYNRIQINIADASLGMLRVSGVFDAADPESFVAFMQSVAHVRTVRHADAEITVERAD
jgi:transmembrane sensor